MACEDFPCCGHDSGDCPSIDEEGKQTFPPLRRQIIRDECDDDILSHHAIFDDDGD